MTDEIQRAVTEPNTPDFLRDQPHQIIERDGVRYTLLGTAHVSKASVDAVNAALASNQFDAIAVELDANRHRAMTDANALAKLDLFQIIREGKMGLMAANLAMAAYQRRLAEQLGVEPGAELKAAAVGAKEKNLPLYLIDRDIGTTLKRAWYSLGFWGRSKLMAGLASSLLVSEDVEESEIEKLKQGDILESSFGEFAETTPQLYEKIIAERDRYMAAQLREQSGITQKPREVLAVVGAGHLKGLSTALKDAPDHPQTTCDTLNFVPSGSKIPWFTILLCVFLVAGFAWGYYHGGADLAGKLALQWVLITGGFSAVGCIASGGHPLSVLSAFVSAPITPLHPALSSGMVSAFVEAWVRKPTYEDFLQLRDDTSHWKGWWKNRVARVFVNFTLTNLATVAAVWVAGLSIVGKLS
jgi:pheromone shutdown-related protein TraB